MSDKEFPFKPERKHIIGHDGIGPIVLAIAIGGVGGFVFNWLKMPLAWMLGSCLFSTVAAFAGLRVGNAEEFRLRSGVSPPSGTFGCRAVFRSGRRGTSRIRRCVQSPDFRGVVRAG